MRDLNIDLEENSYHTHDISATHFSTISSYPSSLYKYLLSLENSNLITLGHLGFNPYLVKIIYKEI